MESTSRRIAALASLLPLCAGACLLPEQDEETTQAEYGAAPPPVQCRDGIDNDGDGKTDWPSDPSCTNKKDDSEAETTTPPPPTGVGPSSAITCPAGAIQISPSQSIQQVISQHPAGTTFCILTGTHTNVPLNGIVPEAGDKFIGQLGAVIDGNQVPSYIFNFESGIDNVVIKNLVLREGRIKGIHGTENSSGTEVAYNDIGYNGNDGMSDGGGWWVHHNYIHHNGTIDQNESYGMGGYQPSQPGTNVVEYNEVAFNVWGAKWVGGQQNAVVRNNYVHDNSGGGYWCDFCGPNFRFEGNTVTNNGGQGLVFEGPCGSSAAAVCSRVIANNTVSGHPTHGIFITTASGSEVYGNELSNNGQTGIQLFIHALNLDNPVADLRDNHVHDNSITVSSAAGWAADMRCWNCTESQAQPWVSNAKNNRFENNLYDVPDPNASEWYWQGLKTWSQWRALGHDDTGTVQ